MTKKGVRLLLFIVVIFSVMIGYRYYEFRQRNAFYFMYKKYPQNFEKLRQGLIESLNSGNLKQTKLQKNLELDIKTLSDRNDVKLIRISNNEYEINFENSINSPYSIYELDKNIHKIDSNIPGYKNRYSSLFPANNKEKQVKREGMKVYFYSMKKLYKNWKLK
ncbi:hypothetical protein [Companilactobacillus sp. DQM5]|uniref:hypothetical protein n=1 Tax=Companilactobacillus sp. DQM5 TaxID=3463359 RepID=UPI0040581C20